MPRFTHQYNSYAAPSSGLAVTVKGAFRSTPNSGKGLSGISTEICRNRPRVHPCALGTWELEAGGLEAQGHPLLHSEFQASLGHMRPCFQNQPNKTLATEMHQAPHVRGLILETAYGVVGRAGESSHLWSKPLAGKSTVNGWGVSEVTRETSVGRWHLSRGLA